MKVFAKITWFFLPVLFFATPLAASRHQKGFGALSVYDYFKARRLFLKSNARHYNPYSCYGLALIFSRSDNPFSNTDSAARYLNLGYHYFLKEGKAFAAYGFVVDSFAFRMLADSVADFQLKRAIKLNQSGAYDSFLENNYLASYKWRQKALYLRDELEYNAMLQHNRSDSTRRFMITHPQSSFFHEARILLDRQLYEEWTAPGTAQAFCQFIKKFPYNVVLSLAYEKLFSIYRLNSDARGLAAFVNDYPMAPQNLEAWKLLFSLSVKAYSYEELTLFLNEYPAFPLKHTILKELELNSLVLYPVQRGELYGYINATGQMQVEAVYESATDFYEGLAVVSRNDSVFYINKENRPMFDRYFTEAHVFRNGLAPVSQNGQWFFINRLGQTVPGYYEEISEASGRAYVIKTKGKYGALDLYGQLLLEAQFDKLGDFKNDYAYYTKNGNYGFVSVTGFVHKPEFDWISDFSTAGLAVFRQNGRYGLVNGLGIKILAAQYDQVLKATDGIYILVNGNNYGFFHSSGCFVSQVSFDYWKDKAPEFYTNGSFFRGIKKEEQQIMDANGHVVLSAGVYKEPGLPREGLMKVLKKKKWGYVDKKQNVVIPFRYQFAGDFKDSLAVVMLKDNYLLITVEGKEVFSSSQAIEKISSDYYLVSGEQKTIINRKGQVVLGGVSAVQKLSNGVMAVELNSGEMRLLND